MVLGGLGNIRGSVIAAALLYVLPELLRDFYDYRMLIYAIVLILVMLATNNERSQGVFLLPAPEDIGPRHRERRRSEWLRNLRKARWSPSPATPSFLSGM